MTVEIVDQFHIVHVRKEDLGTVIPFHQPVKRFLSEAFQSEPVVQPGQAVMHVQFIQRLVELPEQLLLTDVFNGDFQEIKYTLMKVHFRCVTDSVQRDIPDGIRVVMQRIEHHKPFPPEQCFRQEFLGPEADKIVFLTSGFARMFPFPDSKDHFLAEGFLLFRPLALIEVVKVIIVKAQIDVLTAENPPVLADGLHQVLQVVGFKKVLRHLALQVVKRFQEAGLLEIQVPDRIRPRCFRASAGFGVNCLKIRNNLIAGFVSVNHADQHIHCLVVLDPVVSTYCRQPGTGQFRAGQVVKTGHNHILRNPDAVVFQSCHQSDCHFIVRADKRVRHLSFFTDPLVCKIRAVACTPGSRNNQDILFRNIVLPASVRKPVHPFLRFRAAVFRIACQVYQS